MIQDLSRTPLWDRFVVVSRLHNGKPAVVEASSGESLSFGALRESAEFLSDRLQALDVSALAMIGEPTLAVLPVILAAARCGITFIPLADSEPDIRVVDCLRSLPVDSLVLSSRSLAEFKADVFFSGVFPRFSAYRCRASSHETIVEVPYLVTHSSGSTGRPKPIALGQGTKIRRTEQSIALFNVSHADTILSASPFHHSLGQRHFFISLLTGATLIKAYPFRSESWFHAVRHYKPTFSIPVATHLKLLDRSLLSSPRLLDCFRCLVTSSASAEPELKKRILDSAKFEFWEIYGMTETACATAIRCPSGVDTGHLGQAISGTKIRISGTEPVGEIEVKSDVLCDGYWGDSKRWKQAVTSDGYFKSGDLGKLDSSGNLLYLGRANESFQRAGLTIYPSEIESVVKEHPLVCECVAVGVNDPIFENSVVLVVSTQISLNEREISGFCRSRLPKYMWPTKIVKINGFPLLSSGKIDRKWVDRFVDNLICSGVQN